MKKIVITWEKGKLPDENTRKKLEGEWQSPIIGGGTANSGPITWDIGSRTATLYVKMEELPPTFVRLIDMYVKNPKFAMCPLASVTLSDVEENG